MMPLLRVALGGMQMMRRGFCHLDRMSVMARTPGCADVRQKGNGYHGEHESKRAESASHSVSSIAIDRSRTCVKSVSSALRILVPRNQWFSPPGI